MSATQTVWTTTSTNRTAGSSDSKIYHTDKHCRLLKQSKSVTEHQLGTLTNGWRLCTHCAGEIHRSEARTVECPHCGDEFQNLPEHLRRCSA